MHSPIFDIRAMTRPQKLVRAARLGLDRYRRERHMGTLLKTRSSWTDETFLDALIDEEVYHNELRSAGDANYNVRRHVHILIALICEAQNLLRPRTISAQEA